MDASKLKSLGPVLINRGNVYEKFEIVNFLNFTLSKTAILYDGVGLYKKRSNI